ncbi:hypothetical protein ACIA49_38580 [Kribbella sp. NPDC051587]|uniref:hypothetical protein n=1 Tax=Kribbella sp. NPDC051587 TaxID=3364119 RepID=UPI0037ACEECE
MTYTKMNTAACGEMPRPAHGPAGGGAGTISDLLQDFDDLLDGSSFNTPGNPGAPADAHALLDQMRQQRNLGTVASEGDIDDALVHLVDRASRNDGTAPPYWRCGELTAVHLRRPTWVYPLPHDTAYAIDRGGPDVILLRHLSAGASQKVVSFVEYSDPWSARAVVDDLLETNVFATVRPDVARLLITLILDRQTNSEAIMKACEQAIAASCLFTDNNLTLLISEEEGDIHARFNEHHIMPFPAKTATSAPRGPTTSALEVKRAAYLELFRPRPHEPQLRSDRSHQQPPVDKQTRGETSRDRGTSHEIPPALGGSAQRKTHYWRRAARAGTRRRVTSFSASVAQFFILLFQRWLLSTSSPQQPGRLAGRVNISVSPARLIAAITATLAAALALINVATR